MPELKKVGRFTIERVLGKGAMGVVYEAVDPRLGRRVAIKTILKTHLDDQMANDYSMRFEREAQAVARLNHPNIVQVHDFGEEGEMAYLVMEFIQGRELKSYFDSKESFGLNEAVRIMRELCNALDFAHRAGVIHRDVKPGNVMLDSQMHAKLTDFGVARLQDTTRSHVTAAGTLVGTPAYMSPEQIRGAAVDRRTDIFSAGIILYQFLTGEMPFGDGGPWTIAKRIMQDEPALPSSVNTLVSPAFDAVVNKVLAKDPQRRYQTARDLGIALERALEAKLGDEDQDKTLERPAPAVPAEASGEGPSSAGDAEIEFWRSIKDGSDANDFDLYLEQFPSGVYAKLAHSKIAKLRGMGTQPGTVLGAPAPTRQRRTALTITVAVGLVIAAVLAGVWFAMAPAPKPSLDAERTAADKAAQEKPVAEAKKKVAAEPAGQEKPKAGRAADRAAAKAAERKPADRAAATAQPAERPRTFFEKLWLKGN